MNTFKSYDVRGLYPEEINEVLAYKLGKAFTHLLQAKTIAVGYDMRSSSPSLFRSLTQGMIEQGAHIRDIGLCTTPMLSFTVANQKLDGGIMISASHNPSQYNAFKLIAKKAIQLSKETGISSLQTLVQKDQYPPSLLGTITEQPTLQNYLNHILKFCQHIKDLKIVADYSNGVGAISAQPLFDCLLTNTIHLYPKPDGTFPNHPANPHDLNNLQDLQKAVRQHKADVGIFFDGDADRVLVVDEQGNIVFADMLLALLAKEQLKTQTGNIYFDLRFSKAIPEIIQEFGGNPIMMRVGNPYYKEKLINEGGILAGEFSGHIMFQENYGIDDGLFAAIKLLHILSTSGKKLSELVSQLKRYHSSPEINLKVDNATTTLQKIQQYYQDGEYIDIDGIYIQYPEWWFNLRKSNTEPLVRLRLEAKSKEQLEQKQKELLRLIN